jgi:phosphoglycolate phosphatase (TIGR01487 family)
LTSAIQAIAMDYDGTLTEDDRPTADVLDAVREVRARGRAVVLVTGRILSELRAVFPAVEDQFDAIVAENGAVLADADGVHDLAPPVAAVLGQALAHRDIPVRQGRVLLACDGVHTGAVVEEVARLELDCQVVHNRGALMVLPGGVTKGTGLEQALGNLGISRHSTLAIGDAENDHHLLEVCELGVAVANAVDALKDRADLVLEEADGDGIARLLRSPLIQGRGRLAPRGWQLTLGRDDHGNPMRIPASQINLLLTGGSCSGKSYLAGSLIEQLVRLGYSVLVVDLEGDHQGLTDRRGILGTGGTEPLPAPGPLAALVRHRFGSVVLDLSSLTPAEQEAYLRSIAPVILAQRAVTGLPHWIFFDEAHALPAGIAAWTDVPDAGETGYCYSTYRPEELPELRSKAADLIVFTVPDGTGAPEARRYVARISGVSEEAIELGGGQGRAVLIDPDAAGPPVPFAVETRHSGHVRHWHKYIDGQLPEALRFYFATTDPSRVAANLREFHDHLGACPTSAIAQHAGRRDFSRWIGDVLQDTELSEIVAHAEHRAQANEQSLEAFRAAARRAIQARYLE